VPLKAASAAFLFLIAVPSSGERRAEQRFVCSLVLLMSPLTVEHFRSVSNATYPGHWVHKPYLRIRQAFYEFIARCAWYFYGFVVRFYGFISTEQSPGAGALGTAELRAGVPP
jgi:hypothetical protein